MEIPKPSEDDKQFFRSMIPEDPEVEVKPMFGNLGAFVHGNMFAGLFGSAVGVRLAEPDAAELAAVDGAGPFGPAERPMGGYPSLPGAWRAAGPGRPVGGEGPGPRRLAAAQGEEAEAGQEVGPGRAKGLAGAAGLPQQGYCAAGSPLTVSSTRSGKKHRSPVTPSAWGIGVS